MQHLTPVGLSKDGRELVLVSDTGEEFAVPVDHRFRTALRGDQERPGQVEVKMGSALRPRDIQSRIRGGETAEQVAAAAQTTVDAIMAFAAPVLAERAHVAQTALKSSVRRASTEASPVARTLDDASRQHLSTVGVRADDVEWDAWRREDGRWSLVAEYIAGDEVHHAEFTYDPPGRYVLAENDQARLLTGEAVAAAPAPEPARRLSAVPSADADELPLGDDAIELVREAADTEQVAQVAQVEPEDADESNTPTSDLTETVAAVRESPAPAPAFEAPAPDLAPDPAFDAPSFNDIAADHADADWIAEVPQEAPAEQPAAYEPAAPYEAPARHEEPEQPAAAQEPEPAQEELPIPEEPAAREEPAPARKKGRSSVPSWDEIMFGGGKHE